MFKQTALITFVQGFDEAVRVAFAHKLNVPLGAGLSRLAASLPASHGGGDLVWHLHFESEAAWAESRAWVGLEALAEDAAIANIDAVAYEVSHFGVAEPTVTNGVYRTLFMAMLPQAQSGQVQQLCNELAGMSFYVTEILNWAVNPVRQSRGRQNWSHVWEQEFATVEGLTGPYMTHPYHWAVVDRWYDPEMPCQIVADDLCHSASELTESVMAQY